MAGALRLTQHNRQHWKVVRMRVLTAAEDGAITPREMADILDGFDGGDALGAVVDIRDHLGRATTPERVRPMLTEYEAWLPRLPEWSGPKEAA